MLLGTTLILAVVARGAPAEPAGEEDPRAIEARKACAAGEVDRGIKLLAEYLAITDDPTAVYNMGRCYEHNGLGDKAQLQFREYLRKAHDLGSAERAEVEAHIRALEAERPPPAPAPRVAVAAAPEGHRWRTAGAMLAAAGVASAGAGVYFGLRAHSLEDRVTAAPVYDNSDFRSGQSAQTLQFVMYGIGAAAIVGGAIVAYLGLASKPRTVALVPALA